MCVSIYCIVQYFDFLNSSHRQICDIFDSVPVIANDKYMKKTEMKTQGHQPFGKKKISVDKNYIG